MFKMKRLFAVVITLALLCGCSHTSITIDDKEILLSVGESYTPDSDALENSQFISTNASVATFENGVVTGISAGNAEVFIASSDGLYVSKKVRVQVFEDEVPERDERLVYITISGERYHRADCASAKNAYSVTLSQARIRGLTPCGVCKP